MKPDVMRLAMERERGRGPEVAQNMSAPPRTTLTFSALVPTGSNVAPGGNDGVGGGAGLNFICRLDARSLLPKQYQNTNAATNTSHDPALANDRIRVAIVYARAEAAGKKRPPSRAMDKAMAAPVEALADELQDLLAAESLAAAGLPQVGLFTPVNSAVAPAAQRIAAPGLVRTLAILARRRGSLFLRDADPLVWTAVSGEVVDFWTPTLPIGAVL